MLVPRGFVVDEVVDTNSGIGICVRASGATSCCPGYGATSTRIQSRYARQLADLPLSGRPVRLVIRARRFHCDAALCARRFMGRFDNGVLLPWRRRTSRLDQIIHHLGLALGGRQAARFAQRLMLPVHKSMRQIRAIVGAATIDPNLLTAAERIQYGGYLRRDETNAAILELAKAGVTIKDIVRRTGYSRGLVRRVLRGQRSDVFRTRESSLELSCPGSTRSGRLGIAMVPSSGADSANRGSAAV